jgi:hypothetical protein
MRFLKRLLQPGGDAPEPSSVPFEEEPLALDRRTQPIRCRGCGRTRPPYVFAENEHHYCVDCARRSWKLMRLKPIVRRRQDRELESSVIDEAS